MISAMFRIDASAGAVTWIRAVVAGLLALALALPLTGLVGVQDVVVRYGIASGATAAEVAEAMRVSTERAVGFAVTSVRSTDGGFDVHSRALGVSWMMDLLRQGPSEVPATTFRGYQSEMNLLGSAPVLLLAIALGWWWSGRAVRVEAPSTDPERT